VAVRRTARPFVKRSGAFSRARRPFDDDDTRNCMSGGVFEMRYEKRSPRSSDAARPDTVVAQNCERHVSFARVRVYIHATCRPLERAHNRTRYGHARKTINVNRKKTPSCKLTRRVIDRKKNYLAVYARFGVPAKAENVFNRIRDITSRVHFHQILFVVLYSIAVFYFEHFSRIGNRYHRMDNLCVFLYYCIIKRW